MDAPTVVASRYRLLRPLASGGAGEVFEARDEVLGRHVAVKVLPAGLGSDAAVRERFHWEARAAARLAHPGAVGVYDYGEDRRTVFLVMELVDAEPLDAVLRRGRLSPLQTMSVVAQTAAVLDAAHRLGMVHRDVKPANLLLRRDGRVKVTDFGIGRALDRPGSTEAGTVLGAVSYMAPEQVRGERVTPASDLYSLGVVAYECLTGSPPYRAASSLGVALAHLREPVPPLPGDVPEEVARLVGSLLDKDPARRPQGARTVADAAGRLAGDVPWLAGPLGFDTRRPSPDPYPPAEPTRAPRRPRLGRRRRTLAGGAAAVLVLALAGTVSSLRAGGAPLSVRVPALRGDLQGAAAAALRDAHLRPTSAVVDVAGASRSLVISQHPQPGRVVPRGTRVTIDVASGFVDLHAGAFVGSGSAAAVARLRREGFLPDVMTLVTTSGATSGDVVSVTPNGRLREGTVVRLTVQGNRPTVVAATSDAPAPAATWTGGPEIDALAASTHPSRQGPPPGRPGGGGPPTRTPRQRAAPDPWAARAGPAGPGPAPGPPGHAGPGAPPPSPSPPT